MDDQQQDISNVTVDSTSTPAIIPDDDMHLLVFGHVVIKDAVSGEILVNQRS
jgi:hypothetical protein